MALLDTYSAVGARQAGPVRLAHVELAVRCQRETVNDLRAIGERLARTNPEEREIWEAKAAALERAIHILEDLVS